MSTNRESPEHPRSEPEIILPGRGEHAPRGPVGIWMRIDERDGVRRVVITPPGPTAIILGLLFLGLLAGIAFLALAGFLLIWIPIVIAGILLAFASASIRRRWRIWRMWWSNPR